MGFRFGTTKAGCMLTAAVSNLRKWLLEDWIGRSWNKDLWISRINEYRGSRERVAAWCERHQVTPSQLWYWMRKLQKVPEQQIPPAGRPQWVSLRLDESASDEASPLLAKVGAATIEVRAGFDPALLADLVRTLKTLC